MSLAGLYGACAELIKDGTMLGIDGGPDGEGGVGYLPSAGGFGPDPAGNPG